MQVQKLKRTATLIVKMKKTQRTQRVQKVMMKNQTMVQKSGNQTNLHNLTNQKEARGQVKLRRLLIKAREQMVI